MRWHGVGGHRIRVMAQAWLAGRTSIYPGALHPHNPYPAKADPELHAEYERGRIEALEQPK